MPFNIQPPPDPSSWHDWSPWIAAGISAIGAAWIFITQKVIPDNQKRRSAQEEFSRELRRDNTEHKQSLEEKIIKLNQMVELANLGSDAWKEQQLTLLTSDAHERVAGWETWARETINTKLDSLIEAQTVHNKRIEAETGEIKGLLVELLHYKAGITAQMPRVEKKD